MGLGLAAKRFSFLFVSGFLCAVGLYHGLVALGLTLFPGIAFPVYPRLMGYYLDHPELYLAACAFAAALFLTLALEWVAGGAREASRPRWRQGLLLFLGAYALACLLCGTLYALHDMQAGFLPPLGRALALTSGYVLASLGGGWLLLLQSLPLNLFMLVALLALLHLAVRLFPSGQEGREAREARSLLFLRNASLLFLAAMLWSLLLDAGLRHLAGLYFRWIFFDPSLAFPDSSAESYLFPYWITYACLGAARLSGAAGLPARAGIRPELMGWLRDCLLALLPALLLAAFMNMIVERGFGGEEPDALMHLLFSFLFAISQMIGLPLYTIPLLLGSIGLGLGLQRLSER